MNIEDVLKRDTELKFPHIFALSASAGSGKTTCLTERYVQFLLSNKIPASNFRNIVAITFTNKAANEMKKRVIESLKMLALGNSEKIKRVMALVASQRDEISRKAKEIIDDIIHNYSDLNIGTIDSFINSIIRSSSIESGITPDFEVTTNPEVIVEYTIDIILEALDTSEELRKRIDEFLISYLTIEERANWYPKEELLKKINIMRQKENEKGITFSPNEHPSLDINEIVAMVKRFIEYAEDNGMELRKDARNGLNKFIESLDTSSKYFKKDDVGSLFCKNKGEITKELENQWIRIRQKLSEYYETKAAIIFYPYLRIKKFVDEKLTRIKQEKAIIFIDELNAYVNKVIKEYRVPYIYYKLGEEIKHYLIDEFQDTNEIQWLNIKNLVHNSLSEGGSLFYVGDKKQAIYRFRGGKAELFDEVLNDYELTAVSKIYAETISENFRSREEIISFNNQLFSVENLSKLTIKKDGESESLITTSFIEELRNTYSVVEQRVPRELKKTRKGGYVYYQVIDSNKYPTREEVNDHIRERLIQDIKDVLNRKGNTDIAILVRSGYEVKTITGWLLEEGIRTVSESAGDLREHPLIGEIIAFLKFLNDPTDNLAFVSFICGDIFTRATGIQRDEIYQWIRNYIKDVILYRKFQEWKKQVWDGSIGYFMKNVDFIPPYDLICRFLERFNVFQNFTEIAGYIIHLLETIRKMEEDGKNNLDAILQEWDSTANDNLFTVPLNVKSGAVNVMTIHKAKGLDFSVVFLPFAGIIAETDNILFLDDTQEVIFVKQDMNKLSKKLEQAYTRVKVKTLIDELNVFYVGCTRAKDELYIYIPPKIKIYNNLLLNLSPFKDAPEREFGKKTEGVIEPGIRTAEPEFFKYPVISEWERRFTGLKSKEQLLDSIYSKYNRAIKIGNLVHKILSKLTIYSDETLREITENILFHESEDIRQDVEKKIKLVLEDESIKSFFQPENNAGVYCEVDVMDENGETKRIDRLIVKTDSVTIIDFKTGSNESNFRDKKQIKEYSRLIKKIYPGKTLHAFLIYIDPFQVVKVEQ